MIQSNDLARAPSQELSHGAATVAVDNQCHNSKQANGVGMPLPLPLPLPMPVATQRLEHKSLRAEVVEAQAGADPRVEGVGVKHP